MAAARAARATRRTGSPAWAGIVTVFGGLFGRAPDHPLLMDNGRADAGADVLELLRG